MQRLEVKQQAKTLEKSAPELKRQITKVNLSEKKDTNKNNQNKTSITRLSFMTFNIACLPSRMGEQFNGKFLKPNLQRADKISRDILYDTNPPDIIAFQEAFDGPTRTLLTKNLTSQYPYNSGNLGEKILNAGSGLLMFSKYKFIDIKFLAFTNTMAGEEWLANKGFIGAKIQLDADYFVTVYSTHLEAGGAIFKEKQAKIAGTTSLRRGEEMGVIYGDMLTWGRKIPTGINLKCKKIFFMGDLNTTLNSSRQINGVSTGKSNNNYNFGDVKYPGQFLLFQFLQHCVPSNTMEVCQVAESRGAGKKVDPALLAQAIKEDKFTGSTIPTASLVENRRTAASISKQNTEYRIIDGMFCSHEGEEVTFETRIESAAGDDGFYLSDHHRLRGFCIFTPVNKPKAVIPENTQSNPSNNSCVIS